MSILKRLFRSHEKPKNSLFGSAYTFFFGSTTSGKTVNERLGVRTKTWTYKSGGSPW